MNKEKVLKSISQIENAVLELKKEIGVDETEIEKSIKMKKRKVKKHRKGSSINLIQPIRKLFEENFFSDYKKDVDVLKELKTKLLTTKTPKRASVTNVLRKMVKNGLLNREKIISGKRKVLAYKKKSK